MFYYFNYLFKNIQNYISNLLTELETISEISNEFFQAIHPPPCEI